MFKVVSFNINGIRARPHQLQALVERHSPDVIGIQESKVQDADFPLAMIEELGYQVAFHGQKAHYGVALLSKRPPVSLAKGFPWDPEDAQRRLIRGSFTSDSGQVIEVINGYFPQGESRNHPEKFPAKEKFYRELGRLLAGEYRNDQPLVVIGDMNIAPTDLDIGIGEANAKRWLSSGKCSFLPEEREWINDLMRWGLLDAYRELHPHQTDALSWFDYRSRGFEANPKRGLRIDLILASGALKGRLLESGIDTEIRAMEKPSDHCPVWLSLDI